jgi:hypothetical protein
MQASMTADAVQLILGQQPWSLIIEQQSAREPTEEVDSDARQFWQRFLLVPLLNLELCAWLKSS